ncbi:MAG: hypothetical protein WCB49_02345 [Gammaproteobacteria bacterium]
MNQKIPCHSAQTLGLALLLGSSAMLLPTHAGAQIVKAAGPPVTYTRIDASNAYDHMAVSLYRDGAREMIELTRAPNAAHPKGWTSRMWFDFKTHRQYVTDSNVPGKCSVIKYTSDGPPGLLDPVAGAASMAAQIPAGAKPSGTETLNGIRTSIYQAGPGATIWVNRTHHLALKAMVTLKGSKTPQTMLDLTGIKFDKPKPSLLVPPSHCTQIAGESNANGGHAEIPAGVGGGR